MEKELLGQEQLQWQSSGDRYSDIQILVGSSQNVQGINHCPQQRADREGEEFPAGISPYGNKRPLTLKSRITNLVVRVMGHGEQKKNSIWGGKLCLLFTSSCRVNSVRTEN